MTDARLTLGDRYELGDVLGRGGMAEVRLGRDVRLGRSVAVKVLRADLARDPTFQARFRREAQSAAALNHPSIVAVYDTGEDAVGDTPVPYIVMEYVEGSTLRDVALSGRRFLPERALEITADVLDALAYSHRHGIVHRDIKPGNVMLTTTGEVKVMDFGIARAVADTVSTMTQTAAVIGTAQYLSPEQARGEQVDARSDLYSTGCLLYELLTGRPPFVGDSPVAVAYQHVREEPTPPSALDPDLSPAVDTVVLTALAKDREERYPTAESMRADVERARTGRPVEAEPVTSTRRVVPGAGDTPATPPLAAREPARRRRSGGYLALALATAAVLVLALLLGRSFLSGRSGPAVGRTVPVPDVVGKAQQAAESTISGAGLHPVVQSRADDDPATAGKVVEQAPVANTPLGRDDAVTLVVSAGPGRSIVPILQGLSRDDAESALETAGLKVGKIRERDANLDAGTVVSSTPDVGRPVTRGSKVNLTVASGRNEVPDVRGRRLDDARAALQQAGFASAVRQRVSAARAGTVLGQEPGSGRTRRLDSTVTLTVAAPRPTPRATPSPSSTPSPAPSPAPSRSPSPPPTSPSSPTPPTSTPTSSRPTTSASSSSASTSTSPRPTPSTSSS